MAEPIVDNNPNPSKGPDYKAKLDEAASRVKSPPQEDQSSGIIDKVSQYVPAVGRMLGSQENEQEAEPSPVGKNIPGPPERPKHDTQIEEFLKDQHHSKKVVGIDEPTQ